MCVGIGHYRSDCDCLSQRGKTPYSGAVEKTEKAPEVSKEKNPFQSKQGSEPDNNVVNGDDSHLGSTQSEDNPVEIKDFPQDKRGRGRI